MAQVSFLVSRSLCGIELLCSAVQHLHRLLLGIKLIINPCMHFWASTSCKLEVKKDLDTEKKIEKSRYPKKDISTPTKIVTLLSETQHAGPVPCSPATTLCMSSYWMQRSRSEVSGGRGTDQGAAGNYQAFGKQALRSGRSILSTYLMAMLCSQLCKATMVHKMIT